LRAKLQNQRNAQVAEAIYRLTGFKKENDRLPHPLPAG
jgi:hypothetical protein